jgi:hypothetical protein
MTPPISKTEAGRPARRAEFYGRHRRGRRLPLDGRGSMDRMNITMMSALFCAATLSIRSWQRFVRFNFIVQLLIYAMTIARTSWLNFFDGETPDAIATTIFVTSYGGLPLKECLGVRSNRVFRSGCFR